MTADLTDTLLIDDLLHPATGITPLLRGRFADWAAGQTDAVRHWTSAQGFAAETGAVCLLPGADGRIAQVLFGWDDADPWAFAGLAGKLPPGVYRIEAPLGPQQAGQVALAWALAGYAFDRYKSRDSREAPRLLWPASADAAAVRRDCAAIVLVRDLINTPANDLGPEELEQAVRRVADQSGARLRAIVGEALTFENYPLVHTVGRASPRLPRLLDLRWGDEDAPRLTLVGKGVCFDSGGLDLKPSSAMKLMKKDMGGAAHALALAQMVMAAGLPVRLRLLIAAVDNAVSGNAMRPLDVVRSRQGLTVEIGNTDAEGRLILADCLTEADREQPALLLDFATLTGAARTALGPDLPALLTPDDGLAADFAAAAASEADPLWRLPLWPGYRRMLDSKVADINSAPDGPFAGAITAGLFLKEFVRQTPAWAHLDVYGWNPSARPGRPDGGEAMALRAAFAVIAKRFGGTGQP